MGRLPAVAAFALLDLTSACDSGSKGTTSGRSDQVMMGPGTTPSQPATAPAPPASDPPHGAEGSPHKLCDGEASAKGRTLPKTVASHAEASGALRLDGSLPAAHGRWTWINFWASWCGPCRQEIPRLIGWRDQFARSEAPMQLVFVSLDDDARQLDMFLEAQPPQGVRATLWLPDGPARASWLKSLRMPSSPQLPEQVLVDPSGRVRCFIEGAVEDGDYAVLAATVASWAAPVR